MIEKMSRGFIKCLKPFDFLAPLAIRLYLVPVFWMAGTQKLMNFQDTILWFGNTKWGLGLPMPTLMASLATTAEVLGAICLALGFATRLMTIPLMITMLVAIFLVHFKNGWEIIAPYSSKSYLHLEDFLAWLKTSYPFKHQKLMGNGRLVVLNNGVEFAVTYFIMLLSLLFSGPGRFFSLDHWLYRRQKR